MCLSSKGTQELRKLGRGERTTMPVDQSRPKHFKYFFVTRYNVDNNSRKYIYSSVSQEIKCQKTRIKHQSQA